MFGLSKQPAPAEPGAEAPAAAPAAAPKVDTVVEYVLYQGEGDNVKALFSDVDLDVVKAHGVETVRSAMVNGKARPVLSITSRTCKYPLGPKGERLALGSTCDEVAVS